MPDGLECWVGFLCWYRAWQDLLGWHTERWRGRFPRMAGLT